jgi:hypothetical protein
VGCEESLEKEKERERERKKEAVGENSVGNL